MSSGKHNLRGWLLDLYPDAQGLSIWLLGRDGKRHHYHQKFPVQFHIAGPASAPALRLEMAFAPARKTQIEPRRSEGIFLPASSPS